MKISCSQKSDACQDLFCFPVIFTGVREKSKQNSVEVIFVGHMSFCPDHTSNRTLRRLKWKRAKTLPKKIAICLLPTGRPYNQHSNICLREAFLPAADDLETFPCLCCSRTHMPLYCSCTSKFCPGAACCSTLVGPKFPTSGSSRWDRASGLGFPHRFPMFGEFH